MNEAEFEAIKEELQREVTRLSNMVEDLKEKIKNGHLQRNASVANMYAAMMEATSLHSQLSVRLIRAKKVNNPIRRKLQSAHSTLEKELLKISDQFANASTSPGCETSPIMLQTRQCGGHWDDAPVLDLEFETAPSASAHSASATATAMHVHEPLMLDEVTRTIVEERNEDIKRIQSDMEDIHDIFQSLAENVEEQQDTLDVIETQVLQSKDNSESGMKELHKASKVKKLKFFLVGAALGCTLFGPIGALAGAKSAAVIGLCAGGGGVFGALSGNVVAKQVQKQRDKEIVYATNKES